MSATPNSEETNERSAWRCAWLIVSAMALGAAIHVRDGLIYPSAAAWLGTPPPDDFGAVADRSATVRVPVTGIIVPPGLTAGDTDTSDRPSDAIVGTMAHRLFALLDRFVEAGERHERCADNPQPGQRDYRCSED